MKHKLVVLNSLDEEMERKIDSFRKKVSTISGRVRTAEEQILHHDKYCSIGDIKKWILILEEDEVIGITALFGRKIIFNNQEIYLGGIGKVRVREDRRKRGMASIMMDESMRQLKKIDADIAFLCTDVNSFLVKFYEKYGFVKMKQPYTFLSKSGNRFTEKEGMIVSINSKKIFDEIMRDKKPFDIGVGNW